MIVSWTGESAMRALLAGIVLALAGVGQAQAQKPQDAAGCPALPRGTVDS